MIFFTMAPTSLLLNVAIAAINTIINTTIVLLLSIVYAKLIMKFACLTQSHTSPKVDQAGEEILSLVHLCRVDDNS